MESWRTRLVELAPWAAASMLLTLLVLTWAARFAYPFDLEWMEGGMLAHAWRLERGLPIYVEPNPDFVPFVYPPGYSAIVGWLGGLVGFSLPLGRAVSLLGLAGATTALGFGVWRHTGQVGSAVLASVVWLGAFPASGAFYDLVRPDSLAMGFTAWALVLAAERWRGSAVTAGLLLCAGFLCKHNSAIFGLPIALGLWRRDGLGASLRFAAASALPALAFVGLLQWQSGGHFLRYLVEVPASHPQYTGRILPGFPRELGNALPVSVAAVGAAAALRVRSWRWHGALCVAGGIALATGIHLSVPLREDLLHVPAALGGFGLGAAAVAAVLGSVEAIRGGSWRWTWAVLVGITAVGISAVMRSHHGGYTNVYMPVHWAVAFGFGAVLAALQGAGWRGLASVLVGVELLYLAGRVEPERYSPTAEDVSRGRSFVAALKSVEGPVLSPMAAWLPAQAGHDPSLHMISVWDLALEGGPYETEVQAVQRALDEGYFGAVVEGSRPFTFEIGDRYAPGQAIGLSGTALQPRSGYDVRPTRIRVRR